MSTLRLNKFLASRLGLSRRAADAAIAAGKVTVDGQTARIGDRLEISAAAAAILEAASTQNTPVKPQKSQNGLDNLPKVCYNGVPVDWFYTRRYFALNKPVGYVCSRRQQGDSPTIYSLLPAELQSLKTVGRLDRDSSGLILLTNDGDFAERMTHPRYAKTKIYLVELDRPLAPLHQQMIADFGVDLPDGRSQLGLTVRGDDRRHWQVTMHEGRNRQIRRTFAALDYRVIKLHRTTFGPYALNGLSSGQWVELPAPQ